jgi:hypothetical protein
VSAHPGLVDDYRRSVSGACRAASLVEQNGAVCRSAGRSRGEVGGGDPEGAAPIATNPSCRNVVERRERGRLARAGVTNHAHDRVPALLRPRAHRRLLASEASRRARRSPAQPSLARWSAWRRSSCWWRLQPDALASQQLVRREQRGADRGALHRRDLLAAEEAVDELE